MQSYPADEAPDLSVPDGRAIIRRLMCLFAVSSAAMAGNPANARNLVQRWKIAESLTREEAEFLASDILITSEQIQMSWRIEAMIPLMWAIGMFDEMPPPDDQFDANYLAEYWNTFSADIWSAAIPRPLDEILTQVYLIRDLNWSVRDAFLNGTPIPESLVAGVVQERHHALNWLAGSSGEDWDSVATDT